MASQEPSIAIDRGRSDADEVTGAASDAEVELQSAAPTAMPRVEQPVGTHKVQFAAADFDVLRLIGKGAYGQVFQVRHRTTGLLYAMKVMSKAYLIKRNHVEYTQVERDVMTVINFPFLINLKFAFQTSRKLFLGMELCQGGELFTHLKKQGMLLESVAKIYAAEMVLAIEHLHSLGIIHRDLKPENVLVGRDGHIRLTDYGLAKSGAHGDDDSARTICGTNEYMAPEMLSRRGYGKSVDWWSLGALIYEMVTGNPPFQDKDEKRLYEKIRNEKIALPGHLSSACHNILKGLLERNVERRLGARKHTMFEEGGVIALKRHKFFEGINWEALKAKQIPAPLKILVLNAEDVSHFDEQFTAEPTADGTWCDTPSTIVEGSGRKSTTAPGAPDESSQDPFQGFCYTHPEVADWVTRYQSGERKPEESFDDQDAVDAYNREQLGLQSPPPASTLAFSTMPSDDEEANSSARASPKSKQPKRKGRRKKKQQGGGAAKTVAARGSPPQESSAAATSMTRQSTGVEPGRAQDQKAQPEVVVTPRGPAAAGAPTARATASSSKASRENRQQPVAKTPQLNFNADAAFPRLGDAPTKSRLSAAAKPWVVKQPPKQEAIWAPPPARSWAPHSKPVRPTASAKVAAAVRNPAAAVAEVAQPVGPAANVPQLADKWPKLGSTTPAAPKWPVRPTASGTPKPTGGSVWGKPPAAW